jgi:hypothetical protein
VSDDDALRSASGRSDRLGRTRHALQEAPGPPAISRLAEVAFAFPAISSLLAGHRRRPAVRRRLGRQGLFAQRLHRLRALVFRRIGACDRPHRPGASRGGKPRDVAFSGDGAASVYALDAATGALIWKSTSKTFPWAGQRSPVLAGGRIYVGWPRRRGLARADLRVLPLPREHRLARRSHRQAWKT